MKRIKDCVADWPTSAVGHFHGRGSNQSARILQLIVGEPVITDAKRVSFNGKCDDQTYLCSFQASDKQLAEKLANSLRKSKGRTVGSIGEDEMPDGPGLDSETCEA